MIALKKLLESEENTRKQLAIVHSMLIPLIVLGFPKESLSILQAGGRIAMTINDKKSLIQIEKKRCKRKPSGDRAMCIPSLQFGVVAVCECWVILKEH